MKYFKMKSEKLLRHLIRKESSYNLYKSIIEYCLQNRNDPCILLIYYFVLKIEDTIIITTEVDVGDVKYTLIQKQGNG